MNILSLDTETTISNAGNPFDPRNKLCCVSAFDGTNSFVWPIEYDGGPYLNNLSNIRSMVNSSNLIVGFNFKFDLHWLRKYEISLNIDHRIWDCQLAEFILSGQSKAYPSLEETGNSRGLGGKLGGGLDRYWDVDIDTPNIPWEELEAYARRDAELTYKIYLSQIEELKDKPKLKKLIELSCQDLRVLADLEWNGLKMNMELMKQREIETGEKINGIVNRLNSIIRVDFTPNYNSSDFLSVLLYGGIWKIQEKKEIGVYKAGLRAGEVKYTWVTREIPFKRLVEPLCRSELKKEGYYSTSVTTLQRLSGKGTAHEIISFLLEYSKQEKLLSTYYSGIQRLSNNHGWIPGIIHGTYNQVVARTGRLSSSKPNLQNLSEEMNELIISRYADKYRFPSPRMGNSSLPIPG